MIKYCPYAVNRHLVNQTAFDYDDDGRMTGQQVVEHNTADFVKCKQDQCGVWRDGRCHYGQQSET